MSYVTQEELVERYGLDRLVELTDRAAEPTGEIDADVLGRAITSADSVIDGYVGSRYALPFESAPPLLLDIAFALVFAKLHTETLAEKAKADYDEAISQLKAIAAGSIKLQVDNVQPATTVGEAVVSAAPLTCIEDYGA